MNFDMNRLLRVMLLLTGLSLTRGQSVASPPVFPPAALSSHAGTSEPPDLTEDPANALPRIRNPGTDLSTETTSTSTGLIRAHSVTHAAFTANMLSSSSSSSSSSSAVAPTQHVNVPAVMTTQPGAASLSDLLSSTPTVQSTTPLPHISNTDGRDPIATDSSQPAHVSTQPQPGPLATATAAQASTTVGRPLTSASARGPAGPTHWEVPSELNVGDEDKGPHRSSSPLDPLLAGLLSVFIVTTAVIFIVLFLRFRQRTNHPEFHRLQDLPMDDLLEDTPLSRYTY